MIEHRRTVLAAVVAATLLGVVGVTGGALAQDTTLRVAMGSPGDAAIAVWNDIEAQFEAAHPGVDVDMNYQEDDLYQTIGLPTLLSGPNAPDVYFEWTGARMAQRYADGYGADLTDAVTTGPLAGLFDEAIFPVASVDGKVVLVPHTADVTNVLWYNIPLLAEHGVAPPTTWDELLAACDTLNAAGVTPIAVGNKDLWPGGNWMSHIVSRVVGEEAYDAALSGETPFSSPEWEAAFGYLVELAEHDCVNDSANAINDTEGTVLFYQGAAAMHPLGSWLVSLALADAPELEFDFVNLPAMPDGSAGDQGSVIGVETGYMVNANSPNVDLAVEYLALVNSPENVAKFVQEAEIIPLATSVADVGLDGRSLALGELMSTASTIVLPPDTGYDPAVGNELYAAEDAVLGGQATPADALAALDERLGR